MSVDGEVGTDALLKRLRARLRLRWRVASVRRGAFGIASCCALASCLLGPLAAGAEPQPSVRSLHVQRRLSVRGDVHLTFRPTSTLPAGGYYYAVIVLRPYRGYTREKPPPCSTSSDMQRTDYGYPQGNDTVALALTPTSSHTGHWCPGGNYVGAVYAVPHAPPCESSYPCESESNEEPLPSPCWNAEGHVVCGLVAIRRFWSYPDGLPQPVAKGTSVVAHFAVRFPKRHAGAHGNAR
jgi:hypothetical protein